MLFLLVCAVALALAMSAWAAELKSLGAVKFKGDVAKAKNVSADGAAGEFLVIGADEGNVVQVLRREDQGYRLIRDVALKEGDAELDIESVACEGATVYAIGSHSVRRLAAKEGLSAAENRTRLATVDPGGDRDGLFRFTLDAAGSPSAVEEASLAPALEAHPILKFFRAVPGKENGVDIEGLAARRGRLYAGFRGPVLRDNFVPVLACRFGAPAAESELLFVNLGGLGVRDLTQVEGGFLIVAGPVGDGPGGFRLYRWDGADCLPGAGGRVEPLCDLPAVGGAKVEGLAVLKESDTEYEMVIVYDGLKDGGATRYRLTKR